MGGMSGYFGQTDQLPNNLQNYIGGNTTAYSANQTGPGSPAMAGRGGPMRQPPIRQSSMQQSPIRQPMFGFPGMYGGFGGFNPFGGFGNPYGFMSAPMWSMPFGNYNSMTQQMAGPMYGPAAAEANPAGGNPHYVAPPPPPPPQQSPLMAAGLHNMGFGGSQFGGPDRYGGGGANG